MPSIRDQFDKIVNETTTYDASKVPDAVVKNISKWQWGKYGWTSPVSLIITATWRKHFYPEIDCCKIWAQDEAKNPIEGGYSIRSEDESITIPVFAKYDLCNGFCSDNSGMQGSRAIKKMRNLKRLNVDFGQAQRTIFDLKLFALILNQINELTPEQALELLKYEIVTAKDIRQKRIATNAALANQETKSFDLLDFLSKTADPELTKCVVAACLETLFSKHDMKLEGVSDYKTAADARAQKPGDLCLSSSDEYKIAIEVKDKSQTIDWENINRAKKILQKHTTVEDFIFVLENRSATVTTVIQEMVSSPQLKEVPCDRISFMSVHDLYKMALAVSSEAELVNITSKMLTIAPAIKPETKNAFLATQK